MTAAEFSHALLKPIQDPYRRQELQARCERYFLDLWAGLEVYPQRLAVLQSLIPLLQQALLDRPSTLQALDLQRVYQPDWLQTPQQVGYIAYTERFAGNLLGVIDQIPYLQELGVTYLHLMPFLQPRPAPHDGGYAVMDYRKVRTDLGSMQDLETLTTHLRQAGISLCCDLVLNHVAQEHPWAQEARQGNPQYRDYFWLFPDRTQPDLYEQHLPEVFPDFAPGNFSFSPELQRWVWTTFNAWQWDLNWSNPAVFLEFVDLILWLANRGIEVFRLDAIAFIWKRLGTQCQNQPEVHLITQALRACAHMVAPAVAFKAEAIVAPEDLIAYLGQGKHYGLVSDLAYHNTLMVQIWSSLASRDTRLFTQALSRFPAKPTSTAWITYLRCHDDIGWAISDTDAAAVGLNGAAHRRFLSDYYCGDFPGSHAKGLHFQDNPTTGDRRTSGSAASLAGLEYALMQNDSRLIHLAIERLLLAHAVVIGYGEGIPLLYMGDELGLLNDYGYVNNPEHAQDNRWLHRPLMNWPTADKRKRVGSLEQQMFDGLRQLIYARKHTPHLHSAFATQAVWQENPHLLVLKRQHPLGTLVQVYNFSEQAQSLPWTSLKAADIYRPYDHITQQTITGYIAPLGRLWLSQP